MERIFFFVLCLQGKADELLSGALALAERFCDVGRYMQRQRQFGLTRLFLDFLCRLGGRQVRYRSAENSDIHLRPFGHASFVHRLRGECVNTANQSKRIVEWGRDSS